MHVDAHHVAEFAPRAVIAGSCTTSTLRDSAMRARSCTASSVNWSTKHVAFEQQRRTQIGQVELRRGEAFGPVGPADMVAVTCEPCTTILSSSSSVNGRRCLDVADGVERGVVAADAGIEFQRDAHGLEALAEARR